MSVVVRPGAVLGPLRQLGQLGYTVGSVLYLKWNALRRDKDRERAYLSKALTVVVPSQSQAPKKAKSEPQKEEVPENEWSRKLRNTFLDEQLTSVDWDDDAALKKLTNEVLKRYPRKHNLRSSGLNKARAQIPRCLSVSSCISPLCLASVMRERTKLLCAGWFDRTHQEPPQCDLGGEPCPQEVQILQNTDDSTALPTNPRTPSFSHDPA